MAQTSLEANEVASSSKEIIKFLILDYLRKNKTCTQVDFSIYSGKNRNTFSGRFTDLVDENKIIVVGKKKIGKSNYNVYALSNFQLSLFSPPKVKSESRDDYVKRIEKDNFDLRTKLHGQQSIIIGLRKELDFYKRVDEMREQL